MLLPEAEALPDLRTAALDEVLPIRVIVDHQVADLIRPVAIAMFVDKPVDCRFDFTQLLACAVFHRQVKQ